MRGGVAMRGRERSVLVIGEDPELGTALRDRLDRAYVTVIETRPGEELDAMRACRPWPWMVVGSGEGTGGGVVAEMARHPILVVWRAPAPPGLAAHAIVADGFAAVVATVRAGLGATVAGMRLAIGGGIDLPGGAHVASASLEALLACHPRPLAARPHLILSAARILARHGVAVRPRRVVAGSDGAPAFVLAPAPRS